MLDAVPPFANHLPVRIRFGDGVVGELAGALAAERARRPFCVVDPAVAELEPVRAALAAVDGAVVVWSTAPGEPTVASVEAAADALAGAAADAVVAIGGGSTIDTAKAARLVAGQGLAYREIAAGRVAVAAPAVALVAVPTTAGTGSEVSGGAVIADERTGRKAGIASPLLRAQHALVDPELTHGLPPAPTLHGGVDALAQAIAAIVVTCRTPVGDALALEAVRLAAGALPAVVADGADRAARSRLSCASLLAGLAMNVSDCGSEHALGQALGGRLHLPHGLAVALVLAESLEHDRPAAAAQLERVADALDAPAEGPGDGSRAVTAVRALLAQLGVPTLASVGGAGLVLDALADDALADPFLRVAPVPWTREDVLAAYRAALVLDRR
ncbi:MAG: iron-containing alcohol dehydrogenase [Thermoleophilia bacterium]